MQFLNRLHDAVFHSLTPPPGARIEDLVEIPSDEAKRAMDAWLNAKMDAASSYDEVEGTFEKREFDLMNTAALDLATAWQRIQDALGAATAQFEGRKHAARALVQGERLAQALAEVRSHISRQKQHALSYRRTLEHAFDRVAAKHDIPDLGYNHVFKLADAAAHIAELEAELAARVEEHDSADEDANRCAEVKEIAERISSSIDDEWDALENAFSQLGEDVKANLQDEYDRAKRRVDMAKEKLDSFAAECEDAAPEEVDAPVELEEQLHEVRSIVEFAAGPGPRLFQMLVVAESICGKLTGFLHALELLEEELDRASLEFRAAYGAPEPFAMIKEAWERWMVALDLASKAKEPPHPSRDLDLFLLGVWPDERATMEQHTAWGCRMAHNLANLMPAQVYGNPGAAFAFMRERVLAIGEEAESQKTGMGCDFDKSVCDDVPPDVQAEFDASASHLAMQEEAEKAADAAGL